jgi:hypothetical protein
VCEDIITTDYGKKGIFAEEALSGQVPPSEILSFCITYAFTQFLCRLGILPKRVIFKGSKILQDPHTNIHTTTKNLLERLTQKHLTSSQVMVEHLENKKIIQDDLEVHLPGILLAIGKVGKDSPPILENTKIISITKYDDFESAVPILISHLYENGITPNWQYYYEGQNLPKIDLPMYPFSKIKCWVEDI